MQSFHQRISSNNIIDEIIFQPLNNRVFIRTRVFRSKDAGSDSNQIRIKKRATKNLYVRRGISLQMIVDSYRMFVLFFSNTQCSIVHKGAVMKEFMFLLGTYLVVGTAIVLFVHRAKQSQEGYFVGGRTVGGLLGALSYAATTYSAFMMVGLVGLAYQSGIGALIFEISYLIGTLVLLSIYGRKIWRISREKRLISPMELFAERYGSGSGMLATLIAIIALIPYTSSQVIGLAIIFQNFGGFRFLAGVIFATVIIALWAFLGGLRGVALTDAFQGIFMVVVALIGFLWVQNRFKGIEVLRFPNEFWTPSRFINLTLPWFFFALTNPQVLQRLFVLKDRRSLKRMILLFGLFGLFYTLIVTFIGFSARYATKNGLFPHVADRDMVILEVLITMKNWLALPLALSVVFAAVSTANSIVLTLSSMVVRDLFREKDKTWTGRLFIVVLTLLVFLFSVTRPSYIVELSVASSSILLCYLPLLFGIFHWKRGGRYAGMLTLILGAGAAILLNILRVSLGSLYTLAGAFGVFFVVSIVEKTGEKIYSTTRNVG